MKLKKNKKKENSVPGIEKKRIIICGPTGSGKTLLSKRFEQKKFERNISYTSRDKRENEINGQHYNFISRHIFEDMIEKQKFFEWTIYRGNYYGIGLKEWNEKDVFIMDRDGIRKLSFNNIKNSFIIYLDIDKNFLIERLQKERSWNKNYIEERLNHDYKKFSDFKNYDLKIINPNF